MFSDAGPDVRWIGNENGVAGETNWSTIRPESVPFIGASGEDVIKSLQEGHPDGSVWRPGETDVSIRPGWFYHPAEDTKVKTVEQLVGLYFTSVGRNSKLLLNVPPTREGLLHETDVAHLAGMRAALDRQFEDEASHERPKWKGSKPSDGVLTMKFKKPQTISVVDLREDIDKGQRVSSWILSTGGAMPIVLARGTTIGNRLLRRITPITVSFLELRVTTIDDPEQVNMKVYA
jgi:alpha-L-fucosidase